MKKTLAFLLTLMMLFSLSTTAFAETSGGQTLTVEVPSDTVITPSVIITLPVVGDHVPEIASTVQIDPEDEYKDYMNVSDISITLDGVALTEDTVRYEPGVYVYTFTITSADRYTLSEFSATVNGDSTATQTYISEDGKTAIYQFTYSITPSWTLTIPSDQTITYGEENSSVDVRTYISDVQNLETGTPIYVHATHTGTFVETSDSSKTIPFTFSCANSNREANVAFLVNENVMKVDNEERADHWVAESATITITSEVWSAAEPGTYETVISYSSGLTN